MITGLTYSIMACKLPVTSRKGRCSKVPVFHEGNSFELLPASGSHIASCIYTLSLWYVFDNTCMPHHLSNNTSLPSFIVGKHMITRLFNPQHPSNDLFCNPARMHHQTFFTSSPYGNIIERKFSFLIKWRQRHESEVSPVAKWLLLIPRISPVDSRQGSLWEAEVVETEWYSLWVKQTKGNQFKFRQNINTSKYTYCIIFTASYQLFILSTLM